jgi:sec-independent protein translocase protein TatC
MGALLSPVDDEPDDHQGGRMSFLEHLEDLRLRIIYSGIALIAGMIVAFAFMEPISTFVFAPTRDALPPGSALIFTRPSEGIAVYMDIALMAGLILAAPVIMYQVWIFVAPALYATEKRFVVPFVALSTMGTLAGAAFSHYLLFPAMLKFFATFTFGQLTFLPRVEDTFALYVRLLISMIATFQIPTLAFFLAKMRLITGKFLWVKIKYALLIILVAAAVLTPSPDPWNQILFAAPMFALYLIGICVAWLAQPKARANNAGLRLVFTAAVIDHAWRQQRQSARARR